MGSPTAVELVVYTGEIVLVSPEDHGRLVQFKWHMSDGYACRSLPGSTRKLHLDILPPVPGLEVDHINGNKLDNQRSNLRYNTRRGNNLNKLFYRESKEAPIGVTWNRERGRWDARIRLPDKVEFLGRFADMEEARQLVVARRRELIEIEVRRAQEIIACLT